MDQTVRLKLFIGLLAIGVFASCTLVGLLLWRAARRRPRGWERAVALAVLALDAVGAGTFAYATCVEPDWLEVTNHKIQTDQLPAGTHIRIVQLSDLHVGDPTPRWARFQSR